MRIGIRPQQLGTTVHAIRFWCGTNRYREYHTADIERLQLLIGLRQLDIPLEQAAELATMCAAGPCDDVSQGLRTLLVEKRQELARRVADMRYLDQQTAHLAGQLEAGATPRSLINLGKEDEHAPAL